MKLHIVGGFLGSGKTTAIVGATKALMSQGQRVGVVTNDQGKYLVDTAFFAQAHVPTVEVTHGCFCCNYDALTTNLEQLYHAARPDVIFAESVGACADIAATVIKPLQQLQQNLQPTSFSVFVDARLLRRRLLEQTMPFGDNIVYIFDKQIEEAGLLVINKIDLLSPKETQEILNLARKRFPQQQLRLQNSQNADEAAEWSALLETDNTLLPGKSLDIDYKRYGEAKATMAFLEETIHIDAASEQERTTVLHLIQEIITTIREHAIVVGHLKFFIESDGGSAKISFPTLLENHQWEQHVPLVQGEATVLINAHAEANADLLHTLVQAAVRRTEVATGASLAESRLTVFNSGFPEPTYRVG